MPEALAWVVVVDASFNHEDDLSQGKFNSCFLLLSFISLLRSAINEALSVRWTIGQRQVIMTDIS